MSNHGTVRTQWRFGPLTPAQFAGLGRQFDWWPPVVVHDLTFGPNGPDSMRIDGQAVRVRRSGPKVRVEHVTRLGYPGDHRWFVRGFEADDYREPVELFRRVLRPGLVIARSRRAYARDDVIFNLDEVVQLGRYLEMAARDNGDDPVTILAAIQAELGLEEMVPQPTYGDAILRRMAAEPEFAAAQAAMLDAALGDGERSSRAL